MNSSKEYYDSIAGIYSNQSNERMAFLNTVDNLIIEKVGDNSSLDYLDIGSGDGRRALKISNSIKSSNLTLVDDSDGMLQFVNDKNAILHNTSFFEFDSDHKYDLITCLWNVLGHFPSKDHRIEFFHKIEKLLSDNGLLFFDVNNRYNISHYGFESVMKNLTIDMGDMGDNGDTGWFSLQNEDIETKVYIHSPFDIKEYLKDTKLQLVETFFVNYSTGKLEKTFLEGQLVYLIKKI